MTNSANWPILLEEFRLKFFKEGLTAATIEAFQDIIWEYYRQHERHFSWRETTDPYRILVSEIMLQQTQADRVVPKYEHFLELFPDWEALAHSSTADLLGAWQGLGYNRRALALKRAAEYVLNEWGGKLPNDVALLQKLPGVGPYTAAALTAFAFDKAVMVLETNIRRLYIQAFFEDAALVHDKELVPLITATVSRDSARQWYYALMDFGHDLAKMLPNPNTRSKHYTKQSTFHGSHRQLRGKILKTLLERGKQAIKELPKYLHIEPLVLQDTLNELQQEGFIRLEDGEADLLR